MKIGFKRAYAFLRKLNIRNRIAIILLLCILVSTVIIFQVPKLISQNLIKGYLNDYTKSMQTETETSIELMLDDINMQAVRLSVNQNVYDLVGDKTLHFKQKQDKFKSIINSSLSHKEIIGDVVLITREGEIFRYSNEENLIQTPDDAYIKRVKQTPRPVWGDVKKDNQDNSYILLGMRYYNFYTGQDIGCLFIYIRETALSDIYSKVIQDWGYSFIINEDNFILSHPDKDKIGTTLTDSNIFKTNRDYDYRSTRFDGQSVIQAVYKFNHRLESIGVKWEIISVISSKKLFAVFGTINKYIYGLQLALFLLAVFVSFKISSKITAPVAMLKKKLYLFGRGKKDDVIPEKTGDELWELEQCYNDMIGRINGLIVKNNEEKEKQRELELIALQAQINPHFLYNTLDAIGWAAKLKSPRDIELLVMSLAKFFRISLHKGDKFITVDEELELIKSFVTIEQMGFETKFDIEYDVEKEIRDCKMLKIVLQPIIENSIKHGISSKKGKGHISIRGYHEGDDLKFEIRDDGIGFDMESVYFAKSYNDLQHSGYGLRNVNERIKLEYGKDYGLSFESKVGEGTKVEVKLKIRV